MIELESLPLTYLISTELPRRMSMNDAVAVRSLMVDKVSGRLIKAIDERDLSDFIDLYRRANGPAFVIVDFAPAVGAFHAELDRQLAWRELAELVIAKNSIFNNWVRFKSLTKEPLRSNFATQFWQDCEKVLGKIHLELEERYDQYVRADHQNLFHSSKTTAFDNLMCYVSAFIETLLCEVHSTAVVDVESFKHESILSGHADALRERLAKYLKWEFGYWENRFSANSLIYQCVMEQMGIEVDALLSMASIPYSSEQLRQQIESSSELFTETTYNQIRMRKRVYEWPEADPVKLKRVKQLALALQRITALSVLIQQLKDGEFDPSNDNLSDFDGQVESLLSDGTLVPRLRNA